MKKVMLASLLVGFSVLGHAGKSAAAGKLDIDAILKNDSRVIAARQSFKNKGLKCEKHFGNFSEINKPALLNMKKEILDCKKDESCSRIALSHFYSLDRSEFEQNLKTIDAFLSNFSDGIESIVTGQMECSAGIGKQGIVVNLGFSEDRSAAPVILSVERYEE